MTKQNPERMASQAAEAGEFFVRSVKAVQVAVHEIARSKGWWEWPRSDAECIALIHSELSECLEALRHGNPKDEHCPEHQNAVVEMADVVIRVMDPCEARGWPLGSAIISKIIYNTSRPPMHGKKF